MIMNDKTQNESAQAFQILIPRRLFTPEEIQGPIAVVLAGKKIRDVWRDTDAVSARHRLLEQCPGSSLQVMDLPSCCLAPGFIDLHIHGFQGHDVTTGSQEDIASIARNLPQTGVTAFFPTIATIDKQNTALQVQRAADIAQNQLNTSAAEILGLRLEGPFISRAKKGAQYEPGIRKPDPIEMETLAGVGLGKIRIVDFAPEEDETGQLLSKLVQLGIIASIGHTAATYEQTIRAIDAGASHSTHLYNAMSQLEHRSPGVPGAILTDQRVTTEIIADGIHNHPAMLKLAVEARGPRNIALITDAIAPAGLPEGEYEFVGRKVMVREGAVRLESGALAGSTLSLDRAVRNMVKLVGLSWSEAIRMATLTPASIAGIVDRKGCILPGADADLVALDSQGFVQYTWTHGFLTYRREEAVPQANEFISTLDTSKHK
jgi:N-acetylglucosamine-6-phosphate deacetylase